MDFYTASGSTNCRKVDAVVKHLGIDVNTIQVDLRNRGQRAPEYLAINPNGKVPALVDGDVRLWESNAICCYLAAKTENTLWPKTNARYDIMRWQLWETAHFGAAASALGYERVLKPMLGLGPADEVRCAALEADFKRFAAVLDAHLADHRYLVGDQLTLADFSVAAPLTHRVASRLPMAEFKHVQQWLGALEEIPAWRASSPPPM